MCLHKGEKGKVIPAHAMKAYRGIKLIAPLLLTLMWDEGEGSTSCSGCFTPRESTSSIQWKGRWVGHSQPGCYGQDKIILLPPGINYQLPSCVNLLKPYLHTVIFWQHRPGATPLCHAYCLSWAILVWNYIFCMYIDY